MKTITAALLVLTMQKAIAQTESFDIIHYTTPRDWKKEAKEGMVSLTSINQTTGSFCVVVLFASTPSEATVDKDFASQWKQLAVDLHQANPSPATDRETTADGWKTITGAAPIKLEGVDCYLVLTVFSGFGKSVSVLSSLNDSTYLAQLDLLLKKIKLDKKSSVVSKKTTSATTVSSTPATNVMQQNSTQQTDNASTQSFGHMLFTPMPGWSMQRYPSAIIFKPTDLPPTRYLETRIIESKPFSGSLKEALDVSWKDALAQLKLVSPYTSPYYVKTERKSFRGWDYIQCEGTVKRIDDTNEFGYDKYYINLFVIKLNERIERIVTVGFLNINGADYSPYNNTRYQEAIMGFCFSLRFDDWKEDPIGVLNGQPLNGMYEGLKLTGNGLDGNYALFLPNGQVFFGGKLPARGFEGLNTWLYAEENTRNWGTYTINNGKGTLNMAYGKVPLRVSGSNLVITTQNTEHTYEKVPSFDGAVLNGWYEFDGDWGGKRPAIYFGADGKFIDEGALNILNHQTTDPDEFNITARPGQGTYEIRNYTMLFKYSDGRKLQIVFNDESFDRKNPSPASITLSFNDDILYKRK